MRSGAVRAGHPHPAQLVDLLVVEVGPADVQPGGADRVGPRGQGQLHVVIGAGERNAPEHGRAPAGHDRCRLEKAGGSAGPQLMGHRDAAGDVDVGEQPAPRAAAQLTRGQQAVPYGSRAAEGAGRERGGRNGQHRCTVPESACTALAPSTGSAVVR